MYASHASRLVRRGLVAALVVMPLLSSGVGQTARATSPTAVPTETIQPAASPAHLSPITYSHRWMPRGAGTAKSSATAAAAPTPVNTIMYNGGPVQVVPKVVLGFWGSAWNTDFNAYGVDSNQYMNYITNLLSNFGGGGYIGAMSAYCQNPNPPSDGSYPCSGAGAQFITNPTNQLKKVIIINDANPPTAPTDQQFQSVADQMRQNVYGANGNDPDTNYMIFTLPDHPTMVPDQTSCGAHFSYDDPSSGTAVEYTEMPFGPQDSSCNANVLNHTNDSFGHGILDGVSVVMFHEQAETITDPTGTGWTSPDNDNPEVGDACEEPTMASNRQNVPFGPYYGAVQPLYSDFLGGVCVYDQGGEGVTTLHVGDTANASKWSIQSNLQLGNPIFSDRTYTYKSIPSSLLGGSWIQPAAASKSSTVNPLVTFRVGQSTTVEVAVDTRLGRRSWMDSSWVDTSSQIIDSESTPTHFEVFKKSFSAGPVQLGPNAGSGSAYLQYLVMAQFNPRPIAPATPINVAATAGNAQATVTWTEPSDGGSPITSYTVYSSGHQIVTTNGATSAVVGSLTNGTSYTFGVWATNAYGQTPISAQSNAVTPSGPPTAPAAPTGVNANAGSGQATVFWNDPFNGNSPITGYTVTSNPGAVVVNVSGPNAMNAVVPGLTNGTAYTFTVTATNAVGTSPASAPSAPITPSGGTVPSAPTAVSATAGNGQAVVNWAAPSSDGGSPLTGYTITSSPGNIIATAGSAATSATVAGLTNGTPYTFTVTATNAVGTGPASAPSNSVTPTGPTVPSAPTTVAATAGNGQAVVTWTAPSSNGGSALTGYTITSSPGNIIATAGSAATSATVAGLTNGTPYTFTVTATNAVGTGPASAPSNSVTPSGPTVPSAPTAVSATAGNGQALVSWAAPSSNGGSALTGYTITSSPGNIAATAGPGATSTTVIGLTNGTSYTFTVTAANAVGTGPASAPSNSVTPSGPTVPSAPTAVSATAGNGQALVSWAAPSSNGGSALTGYTITSSPGNIAATAGPGATSTTVIGLTNGTSYTFTVTAANAVGTGPASAPSNSVTPTGSATISNLVVGDTTNASKWSIQQNLQVGNLCYIDRTYTMASIPTSLQGSQWLRPSAASKTSTANPLVSFTISGTMAVSVAVDTRLGKRSWMDASWVDSGTQIVDNESTPTHFEIFQKTFSAGTVSLGPNVGSGSSYVQYLVIAK